MQKSQGNKIHIRDSFYFYFVVLILTVPIRWLLAAVLSAIIHECCHIMAIRCFGKEIICVEIGMMGAQIRTEPLYGWREILCMAAGPAGSLAQLFLFRWLPLTAFCGIIQGLFNLIPVYPLDGGRILECLLRMVCTPELVNKMMKVTEAAAYIFLFCLAIIISGVLKARIWVLILLLSVIICRIFRKTPCKLRNLGVQ